MIIQNLQEFIKLLKPNQPLISIDYGMKKVGISISSPEQTMALPLTVVKDVKDTDKIKTVLQLIKTHKICAIVIGLPIMMDGSSSDQTELVQKFATKLSQNTGLPIYLQDERLTSKAADNLLKEMNLSRKVRNNNDDAIAASLILDSVLSSIRNV